MPRDPTSGPRPAVSGLSRALRTILAVLPGLVLLVTVGFFLPSRRVAPDSAAGPGVISPAAAAPTTWPAALTNFVQTLGPDGHLVLAPDQAFQGKKYYALYFSAGWCPPCHVFTPRLVGFYKQVSASHPELAVIFVSRDNSAAEMEAYMREAKMPWLAIRYEDGTDSAWNHYAKDGIPQLVLLDAQGKVLADTYEGDKYVGPERVLVDLQQRLAAGR